MEQHQRVFKIASVLLQHPEMDWIESEELNEEITRIDNKLINMLLKQFLKYVKTVPFMELCENYTQTFDFNDKTTLYLTYPIFSDTSERGKGLLKLKQEFSEAGFPLESDELPDYLPLVLEFCSIAPIEAVRKMLLIHRRALDHLLKELTMVDNPYQFVLQACIQMFETILYKRKAS